MKTRTFSVYWLRSPSLIGVVEVDELKEDGRDVTHLVMSRDGSGGEYWFRADEEHRIEALRAYLATVLGCSIDAIEIEESDEEEVNVTNALEFK